MSEDAPVAEVNPVEETAKAGEGDGPKKPDEQGGGENANNIRASQANAGPAKPEKASGKDFFLCIGLLFIFLVVSAVGAIIIYFLGLSESKVLGKGRIDDLGIGVVNKQN